MHFAELVAALQAEGYGAASVSPAQMPTDHAWQLVPGVVVETPSFGRGVVTFVSGGHAHVRTPEGLVTERADELQLPAVRRLDGVLVCMEHAREEEELQSGVVC